MEREEVEQMMKEMKKKGEEKTMINTRYKEKKKRKKC